MTKESELLLSKNHETKLAVSKLKVNNHGKFTKRITRFETRD